MEKEKTPIVETINPDEWYTVRKAAFLVDKSMQNINYYVRKKFFKEDEIQASENTPIKAHRIIKGSALIRLRQFFPRADKKLEVR